MEFIGLTGRTSLAFLILTFVYLNVFVEPSTSHSTSYQSDGDPHRQLFSRVQRIKARMSRETHVSVRGSQRFREKREIPITSTLHHNGEHVEKVSVDLPLDGKLYTLDLQLNRDLVPKGYFERTQKENKTVVHRPSFQKAEVCQYQGKVRGIPDSWAALSTCDDIIRGAVFDGEQLHYIEPDPSWSKEALLESNDDGLEQSSSLWQLVHLKHSDLIRNFSCGHGDSHDHSSHTNDLFGIRNDLQSLPHLKDVSLEGKHHVKKSSELNHRVKRSYASHEDTRVPYNSNAKSRYVELVIVVDNKKFKELGADLKEVRRRTKDIVSIVNALYAPLNIFIALVGMVVWTESDEISIKPNGDETLASFLHYRKVRLLSQHPNDNAQLLTAVEFENGVVGKAMQGPICSFKYSGGVNSDFKNNVIGVVATTVAHELGHNFGLSHDTESCTCPSPNNRCIMAASASSNRTMHWSSCSLKDFAYAFDHGMDYCLRNKPTSLYDGPTCGNGFTEPGEECDCGLPEHCDNPCCDADTCTMHLNATCASGTCCDIETCHVKPGGSICREATKLCDLPEFCTGDSEFCPEDVTKMDGITCETPSGKSYCYNGECRTHTDQCRLLWGPSGNNSNVLCYQKNANGSRHAHCGYDLQTDKYAKCQMEDVKCGILHCQMNSEKLEFGYESVSILASFFVNAGGKIHPCRSVIVDFGLSDINPGMVPDGAKCGDDKMCVNQKCVPVSSILGTKYPVCAGDCNDRGVCNSKGHCHCDDGYGGWNCDAAGHGGSVDSGPASDPYGTSRFFKILYVTFLGFIPLIAIITFYIYYAGDYFKKLCFSIITLQAFTDERRSPRGNKPTSNGSALRPSDISSPTPNQNQGVPPGAPQGPGEGQEGETDFFGQYKGFSLSPIKTSPLSQQRNGTAGGQNSGSTHNNNNNDTTASTAPPVTTAATSLPNGSIQSQTNANVYYSCVPKQNETLLGNSGGDNSRPGFRVGNPQTGFLQGSGNRSVTRVSWAQPIASPLPVSPVSEDESANSDTPLYENTGQEKSSPKIQKLGQASSPPISSPQQKNRPMSSPPEALNEMKRFFGKGSEPSGSGSPPVKKESMFGGSTSALSRLAAAFPSFRNSFRGSSSNTSDNDKSPMGSSSKLAKGLPKNVNRGSLEISQPIIQNDGSPRNSQLLSSGGGEDQVDANARYSTFTRQQSDLAKKPALKNSTPEGGSGSKQIPKVQRAHSMIQPNRNSTSGNPNYNSLRRPRPSAPPPKPPEAPPPPPPTYGKASSFSDAKAKFLLSQSQPKPQPPPVPPPNSSPAPAPAPPQPAGPNQSPKGLRSSIAKFSLGNRSRSQSPSNTISNKPSNPISFFNKAPIAKVEELSSPLSPPNGSGKKDENIYDTIDEGMVVAEIVKPKGLMLRKDSCEGGSSSGDSSPTQRKKSTGGGSLEKIETLSSGSSESNNGGLLSEIIFEIQSRNKESIYNSVDRRKQKREKKAAQLSSAKLAAEGGGLKGKPEITPKPSSLTSLTNNKSPAANNSYNDFKTSNTTPATTNESKSTFSPTQTRQRYVSPLSNSSFSFYKKPTNPSSTPPAQDSGTLNKKSSLNPTPVNSATSSRPSLSSTFSPPSITPPKPLFTNSASPQSSSETSKHSTIDRDSRKPNGTTALPSPAATNNAATKPIAAVNGVPKVTTSPSYVAKINYFSNLSQASNTPMKPINSIPAPSKENAAKEIIYASSNLDIIDGHHDQRDGCGGERGHYAATIRRSRPVYYNNKDLENDLNDANSNPVGDNSSNHRYSASLSRGRKPAGIYGSLGRKVATPVIRSNSIEKEKYEARSRESTPDKAPSSVENEAVSTTTTTSNSSTSSSPQIGYKPFNPYLNRTLTFSTFRPNNSNSKTSSNNGVITSPANKLTMGSNPTPNKTSTTAATCSFPAKPGATVTNGVGVASPVQLRSPNRLVK